EAFLIRTRWLQRDHIRCSQFSYFHRQSCNRRFADSTFLLRVPRHSARTLCAEMRKLRVPISVLVVDDDRDARAMYRMYLKHAGCKVRTALYGIAAIAKAKDRPPDVIVMDLAMPRLDGWIASRWLKSSPATAHIPIIA